MDTSRPGKRKRQDSSPSSPPTRPGQPTSIFNSSPSLPNQHASPKPMEATWTITYVPIWNPSLEALPVEMVLKIFLALASLADLAAFINSSPRIFQIYLRYRSTILLTLLRNFAPKKGDFLRGAFLNGHITPLRNIRPDGTPWPANRETPMVWPDVQFLFNRAQRAIREQEWWHPDAFATPPRFYNHTQDLCPESYRELVTRGTITNLPYDTHSYLFSHKGGFRSLRPRRTNFRTTIAALPVSPHSPLTHCMRDYPFKLLAYYYHHRPQKEGDSNITRVPPSPVGASGPDGIIPRPIWDISGLDHENGAFDEHFLAFWRAVEQGRTWSIRYRGVNRHPKVDFMNPEKLRLWKAMLFLEIMSKRCVRWGTPTEYWWRRGVNRGPLLDGETRPDYL